MFTLNVKVNVHTINTSCSKHLAQTYPLIQKQKRDSFRCETLNRGSDNCFIDIAEFPDKMVAGVTRSAPSVTVSAGARASACVSQGVAGTLEGVLISAPRFHLPRNLYDQHLPQIFAALKELSKVQHCALRCR